MTKTIFLTILIATVFAVGSVATNDAFASGYLKVGDIKGESTDVGHEGEIEILSWSWGETQSGTHVGGGGGGAGKVSMQDFHFVMQYNSASPVIMQSLAEGRHFDEASLTLTRAGGDREQTYLKITFSDLLISSYQTGGSAEGDIVPVDTISLNFGAIKFEYTPQKEDGSAGEPVTGFASKKPGHR